MADLSNIQRHLEKLEGVGFHLHIVGDEIDVQGPEDTNIDNERALKWLKENKPAVMDFLRQRREPAPERKEPPPSNKPVPRFLYLGYTTNRHKNAICLRFVEKSTGEEATAYLRVDCHHQRGSNRGQPYENRQRFFPRKNSKFRKLWLSAFAEEPPRWANAWRAMGRLSEVVFTGEIEEARTKKGDTYIKLKNLRPLTRFRKHLGNI